MFAPLAVLFLVVPFVELFLIVQVGQEIGVFNTIAVLVLISVVGAWLVKREGLGVVRRAMTRVEQGHVPGRELVDGVMILFAGALLLTPGFLTDVFGILLLLPPVRAALRGVAVRTMAKRAHVEIYR